jgi:hypothetical protein
MEKALTKKIEDYVAAFKNDIRAKIVSLDIAERDKANEALEFVMEYPRPVLDKEDFSKRNRTKSSIPETSRCVAKISGGEQCTRRKKDGSLCCGTHSKWVPPDDEKSEPPPEKLTAFDVVAHDIRGIVYYIDGHLNVFKTEDIVHSRPNPAIIARAVRDAEGVLSIPELGI